MKKKRKAKPLLIILILLALCLLGVGIGWSYLISPVNKSNSEDIEVVVTSGMTSTQIGHVLKEKNLPP